MPADRVLHYLLWHNIARIAMITPDRIWIVFQQTSIALLLSERWAQCCCYPPVPHIWCSIVCPRRTLSLYIFAPKRATTWVFSFIQCIDGRRMYGCWTNARTIVCLVLFEMQANITFKKDDRKDMCFVEKKLVRKNKSKRRVWSELLNNMLMHIIISFLHCLKNNLNYFILLILFVLVRYCLLRGD